MLKGYTDYAHLPLANETAAAFNDQDALSDWSVSAVNAMKAADINSKTQLDSDIVLSWNLNLSFTV